jgi:diacylglycerol kinase (ATP)
VIVNPYAARGAARKKWATYQEALLLKGIRFECLMTEYAGHATVLAREAARQKKSPIIAAGGDGTISEVINGIVSGHDPGCSSYGPLGILPLGSSNDLARTLGIPIDPAGAAETIARGKSTFIDLAKVNDRFFILNAAVGLEARISTIQTRIPWISGPVRYKLASLLGLVFVQEWEAHLTWDSGTYSGPLMLLSVGNAPSTGGFYIAPHADIRDGLLTFVYAPPKTRRELLRILPKALNKPGEGNYVEEPGIFEVNTPWLDVEITPSSPAHADGEIISTGISHLSYSLQRQCVEILV